MPRIPEETIDRIREAVDIVDVVSEHVQLTQRGRNYVGLCPFHDDHDPSFNVSQEKQIYKCFVCDAGGNVYSFLQNIEGISFVEAVRKVGGLVGIDIPQAGRDPAQEEAFDAIYSAVDLARKYYHHLLTKDASGGFAREYLAGRSVTDKSIGHFSLGYAPNAWDSFLRVATKRGHDPKVLEKAGLVVARKDGSGYYDRFRHRVIWPIRAQTGRTIAFGARALDPDEQAKYLNSPETPIYHKSNTLYGLWEGRDAIRTEKRALVVEGYMDHLALVQQGFQNVVATSGTALTPQHARLLKRFTEHAVLVFDGDTAGSSAAVRGVTPLVEAGIDVRIVSLPEGEDPDDFVRTRGRSAFHETIDNALPAMDFLIQWVATLEDLTTADGRARATRRVAEIISHVSDTALRQFLIRDAAQKLETDESVVIQEVKKASERQSSQARRKEPEQPVPAIERFDPRPRAERELLIQMMSDDFLSDTVLAEIKPEDFTNSVYRYLAKLIAYQRSSGLSASVAHMVDSCNHPIVAQIISSMSLETGISNPDQLEAPIDHYVLRFTLNRLNTKIAKLQDIPRDLPDEEQIRLARLCNEAALERDELLRNAPPGSIGANARRATA
ncbi:MAG: DNA primase [Gemmatimonadetes bacterium]|nr:DNA primase [Gemmatimonadota bacterium]